MPTSRIRILRPGRTLEGQIICATPWRGRSSLRVPRAALRAATAHRDVCWAPRGWHRRAALTVDGEAFGSLSTSDCSSSTRRADGQGGGPYFYLPKLESHLEARLWNDVFVAAQNALGIPRGTIRHSPGRDDSRAFEDEILYELREHSAASTAAAGLHFRHQRNSAAARLRASRPRARDDGRHFLKSYVDLLTHLPPPRHPRDGGLRPRFDQGRRRANTAGARKVRRTSTGMRGSRRYLGRTSGLVP